MFFRYLYPLQKDAGKEKKDLQNLMELRNNVCGGMALINILWVAINFMFQYKKPTVIDIPLSVSIRSIFRGLLKLFPEH